MPLNDDPLTKAFSNPLSAFALLMNPQAMQLLNMVSSLRQREQEQQFEVEDRTLRREQIARQNQNADLDLQLRLNDAGAVASTPQLEALYQALGPPVERPVESRLGRYYVPTPEQRTVKEIKQLQAKKQIETEAAIREAVAKETALAPVRTQNKIEEERQLGPVRTRQKINEETQLGPLRTKQRVEEAKQLSPVRVKEARDRAEAIEPFKSVTEKSLPAHEMTRLKARAELQTSALFRQKYPQGIETPEYRNADDDIKYALALQGKRYVTDIRKTPEYAEIYNDVLARGIEEASAKRAKLTPKKSAPKQADPLGIR